MQISDQLITVIPLEEWKRLNTNQEKILDFLANLSIKTDVSSPYITANEFMDAVRIRRSKFDQLVSENKIETLKKGRKIYVKSSEVSRYFNDPSME
jgi:SAM-dependent MidA family methyltransferase